MKPQEPTEEHRWLEGCINQTDVPPHVEKNSEGSVGSFWPSLVLGAQTPSGEQSEVHLAQSGSAHSAFRPGQVQPALFLSHLT